MTSQRYFTTAFTFSLLVGLFACTQSVTVYPEAVCVAPPVPEASAPLTIPSTTPVANRLPENSSQVTPSKAQPKDRNFTACMEAVAYDPEDDSVNLRDRPNGSVITSLPNLSLLQAEGPAGAEPGWNRVFAVESETWGFVLGDLIYRTYYQVQDPQDTSANVRRSPNGEVITAVPNGTEVRFLGIDGTWTQVQLDSGETGYISTQLLSEPSCF
jgi:hypothetical protein